MNPSADEARLVCCIPGDHPSLAGHFPGRPIVPGVVLLDLAQAAARRAWDLGPLSGLPTAKFLAPLLPGEAAEIRLQHGPAGSVRFQVLREGRTLAQGTLAFAA